MPSIAGLFRRTAQWARPIFDVDPPPQTPSLPSQTNHPVPPRRDATRDNALLGTLDALRSGGLDLCRTERPPQAPVLDLRQQIEAIGREHVDAFPAGVPVKRMDSLQGRVQRGDGLPVLRELAYRMAEDASAAAMASRDGAMAGLLESADEESAAALSQSLQQARQRLQGWERSLEEGFMRDGQWQAPVDHLRSQLGRTRTALDRIDADLLRCRLDSEVRWDRLPPEASVLAEVAMLRTLDPQALDPQHQQDHDAQALIRMADRLTTDLWLLAEGLKPQHAQLLNTLSQEGVRAIEAAVEAAEAVGRMGRAASDPPTKEALARLRYVLQQLAVLMRRPDQLLNDPDVLRHRSNPRPLYGSEMLGGDRPWPQVAAAVRDALGTLWTLRGNHEAVLERMQAVLPQVRSVRTRIELARVAMNFLDENVAGYARVRQGLARLALGQATVTSRDIDHVAGRRAHRREALFDRLAEVTVSVPPAERQALVQSLLPHHHEDLQLDGVETTQLPLGTDWLKSSEARRRVTNRHAALSDEQRMYELAELAALASNLEALRGDRHHLVEAARTMFNTSLGWPDPHLSASWYAVISNMVAQVADESMGRSTGDKLTRNAVLSLARRFMSATGVRAEYKARLAQDLLPMVRHLSSGRWNPVADGQGRALAAMREGLLHLPPPDLAATLSRLLDERSQWSAQRRASSKLPGTREEIARAASLNTGMRPLLSVLGSGSSPRDKGREIVVEALRFGLIRHRHGNRAGVRDLLPLCHRLLREAGSAQAVRSRDLEMTEDVLCIIVKGGLPPGLSTQVRDDFLDLALGKDPALRAAVVDALIGMCSDKNLEDEGSLHVAAARYLQNLVSADAGVLGAQKVERARQAIDQATAAALHWPDTQALEMLGAMVSESLRDGMEVPQSLSATVARHVLQRMNDEPGTVAPMVSQVLGHYAGVPLQERRRFNESLISRLPAQPATRPRRASPQFVAVAWFGSLARLGDHPPARPAAGQDDPVLDEIADTARRLWPRLNTQSREAVLHDLFNSYGEAGVRARQAMLGVLSELDDAPFVTGAVHLIRELATAGDEISEPARAQALAALTGRMQRLSAEHLNDLATSTRAWIEDWPRELVEQFASQDDLLSPDIRQEVQSRQRA